MLVVAAPLSTTTLSLASASIDLLPRDQFALPPLFQSLKSAAEQHVESQAKDAADLLAGEGDAGWACCVRGGG